MGRAHVSTQQLVAGRYRLLDIVHRETNRISWYGEDVEAERPCLVTQIGLPDDPALGCARNTTARVIRTGETIGMLCSGRVPAVFDAVEETGLLWIVNEWAGGTPLGELLTEQGPFTCVRAARIGLQVLDVLEAAHGQGITHGELSPGQVFVRDEGSVIVTGFGLAGATLAPRLSAPSYASPEQARDERIGPAADLWALGAILYTLVEGRPPFRDRGRPEATLKGVDRLPLRTPVRAGSLTQVVQGLLRKDSRDRLTRPVVRQALTRALTEDPGAPLETGPRPPRLRVAYAAALHAGSQWNRRTMVAGTALAVVTVAVAVLAATRGLPGDDTSASGPEARPPASAADPGASAGGGGGTAAPSASPPPTASPSPSPSPSDPTPPDKSPSPPPPRSSAPPGDGLPPGYHRYHAPEGFSVALPQGWKRLETLRQSDVAYRAFFGADGDHRLLAVTYSERVGPDPVAVWRDDVEPGLEQSGDDYRRIGDIRATTYQGRKAADMQWLIDDGDTRVRTFGRGFLIGDGRSFSLRWSTPADEWEEPASQESLRTFLDTFRPGAD
ncbi:serine/threonine-protein kinase [Streptomyces sp. TRM68367]|uniref:serine/threonine protein kinase n=1 Tax=Streptomyces sp. TRM68367 TaxID=2758415 RepID=UPI00165B35EC|nr:serine/threonine-protein kinase [Streptomyces sp. TRM68367]MBC9727912.1 serine/threonine protein kinase [Streptomyces sp. TRM68367]